MDGWAPSRSETSETCSHCQRESSLWKTPSEMYSIILVCILMGGGFDHNLPTLKKILYSIENF